MRVCLDRIEHTSEWWAMSKWQQVVSECRIHEQSAMRETLESQSERVTHLRRRLEVAGSSVLMRIVGRCHDGLLMKAMTVWQEAVYSEQRACSMMMSCLRSLRLFRLGDSIEQWVSVVSEARREEDTNQLLDDAHCMMRGLSSLHQVVSQEGD